jgi:hypothetical protein
MKNTIARGIYERVMSALELGYSATDAFKHQGKSLAIDAIWINRDAFHRDYLLAQDKLEFLEKLPWIRPVTKYHLAKNFAWISQNPTYT